MVHTTAPRSGSYTAQVGEPRATDGDSAIVQTFTTSPGSSTLSFWYQIICTGTVEQDWATVILKDNVTGGTETILPKTCTKGEGWKQISITTLTPDRSYTLTLICHDDNSPTRPTVVLYDDIVLG
ncbi:MAG: hypothetical protein H0T78_08165 [Longispora sp.]|nr:hypothetical protein [Longispora sp. (in: high G+C Gram-positive bacteria)]